MLSKEQLKALPTTADGQKYNPANHTLMILRRNFVLGSTLGHRITFRAGKETPVPNVLIEEALALGAERLDGKDHFEVLKSAGVIQPLSPEARHTAVAAALETVFARNNREDFTAAGNPTLKALEAITNFKVDKLEQQRAVKERNDALAAT